MRNPPYQSSKDLNFCRKYLFFCLVFSAVLGAKLRLCEMLGRHYRLATPPPPLVAGLRTHSQKQNVYQRRGWATPGAWHTRQRPPAGWQQVAPKRAGDSGPAGSEVPLIQSTSVVLRGPSVNSKPSACSVRNHN